MNISSVNNRIGPTTASATRSKQRSTHEQLIHKHAQHLSKEKRDSIIETVRNLQASGESVEEISMLSIIFLKTMGSFPPSQLVNVRSIRDKGIISKIDAKNLNKILDRVSEMKMEEKSIDEIKEEIESLLKRLGVKITSNTSVFIDILT